MTIAAPSCSALANAQATEASVSGRLRQRWPLLKTQPQRLGAGFTAALLSSGQVLSTKYWQSTAAEVFVGFLGLLRQQVNKPVTVILDNASIHKAKSTRPFIEWLAKHQDLEADVEHILDNFGTTYKFEFYGN